MAITGKKQIAVAAFSVVFVTLLVFLPALKCGFINFDDPEYVLNNPVIRALSSANLAEMFAKPHVGWWMPLTWLSLAIDYHFWGLNPVGYHFTNIIFHGLNAGLVVLVAAILCRMILGKDETAAVNGSYFIFALFAAALFFGIHPLRVESVAWVTERKDVLNGFFTINAILFYLLYLEKRTVSTSRRLAASCYILALVCFSSSLLAKSTSVILPVLLLTIDWAPLGRLSRDGWWRPVVEKLPFLAVAVGSTFWTLQVAAQSRYLVTYEAFPFSQRLVVSGNAIWEYVRLTLLPLGLSPFNVIPDPIPVNYTVTSLCVAVAVSIALFIGRSENIKSAVICFLLPLLPVLAFFQNGDQSFADRFTYLPSLVLAVFLPLAVIRNPVSSKFNRIAVVAVVGVLVVYVAGTIRQIGVWNNSETFWSRIIAVEPLAITYKERGKYYNSVGRYDAAVADFSAALAMITPTLKPYEFNFYAFRGEANRLAGHYPEAVADFTKAINMRSHPVYLYQRGLALQALGRQAEAAEDYRRAGADKGPVLWVD